LKDFIGSYFPREDRISEKLKICYEFIKELSGDDKNNVKDNIKYILSSNLNIASGNNFSVLKFYLPIKFKNKNILN
jgi:hypothetical protein